MVGAGENPDTFCKKEDRRLMDSMVFRQDTVCVLQNKKKKALMLFSEGCKYYSGWNKAAK